MIGARPVAASRLMPRRVAAFLLPSIVAASAAAFVAGLSEAVPRTTSILEALASAGYVSAFAVPIGLALSLLSRLVWLGWRPAALARDLGEDHGAAPRLAAWALFLIVAAALLATATFNALRVLFDVSNKDVVVALAMPIVVVTTATLLAALSRPSVDLFAALFRRLDRLALARLDRPATTPGAIVCAVGVVVGLLLTMSWLVSIAPRIGHLELGFLVQVAIWLVVLIAVPASWHLFERRPRIAGPGRVTAIVAVLVAVSSAFWLRHARPYAMLEIWGDVRLAGLAIDRLYDIEGMRGDLDIEGIAPATIPGASHPNIVLVTIDTFRADRSSLYGGPAKMPALEKLGDRGAVFDRAYAPGNVTRRSLPSLAMGASPARVSGRVVGWALRIDPRHVTVAERLRAAGYDTAGFFCCGSQFGKRHRLGLIRGLDDVNIVYDGAPLSKAAVDWLGRRKERGPKRPLFLWMHYIEPHNWTKDHREKGLSRRKRYDASLVATDAFLGDLLAGVRAELGDDTIVVVTSDHGEGLGDHGVRYHSGSLYDSEIRVPLVIAGPGVEARRLNEAVGLVDLTPTLIELAGYQPPGMPAMDGLSLAKLLRGERDERAGEAYSAMIPDRSVEDSARAIVSGRFKLIARGDGYELYDLESDPDEDHDLRDEQPRVFESMKARLERRLAIDRVTAY